MAALTKDGKARAAIDDTVLSILILETSRILKNAGDVVEAIDDFYGLSLSESQVQLSLDDHMEAGRIIFEPKTYSFQLPLDTQGKLKKRIDAAKELECHVRDEWLATVNPSSALDSGRLWQCLCAYLAKVFYRHGAETLRLFNPSIPLSDASSKSLSGYLMEAIAEAGLSSQGAIVEQATRSFFTDLNPERTRYLAQLLDGTFTFFALSVDEATSAYLQGALEPLKIFLDTNYIFGIMNISVNPLVEVSRELIDFIRENELPFDLYYHDATLEEMKSSIGYAALAIKGRKWKPRSSRVAISSGLFDGLVLRFHEQNAQSPVDPDVFLSPYDQLPTLLGGYGFKHWEPIDGETESIEVKGSLIAGYKEFMDKHRPWKEKPYEALNHDIEVWLAVQKLRKGQYAGRRTVLDVGALFLTNDTYFRRFDWEELRKQDAVGSVILPNHLLQVIRPFVPANPDFDRRFVQTIASPEFRVAGNADPETASKVLSFIDTYNKFDERTALHMLTDTILADQVRQARDDDDEVTRVLENALLLQNAELLEQRDKAEQERRKNLGRAEEAEKRLSEKDSAIAHLQGRLDVAVTEGEQARVRQIEKDKERDDQVIELNDRLKRMEDSANSRAKIMRACFIAILGMVATALITRVFVWNWWWNHPKWWQLLGCVALVWIGLGWSAAEPKHRLACLMGVAGAAVLVFLQIG